jgi:hypothetical protein
MAKALVRQSIHGLGDGPECAHANHTAFFVEAIVGGRDRQSHRLAVHVGSRVSFGVTISVVFLRHQWLVSS